MTDRYHDNQIKVQQVKSNIKKLEKRYPEGHFSEFYSENRKKDDR